MANKYLSIASTGVKEVEFTVTSAGAEDSGKAVALDTDGKLSSTVLPSSDSGCIVVTASGNITAGYFVSMSGTQNVWCASPNGRPATHFVRNAISNGATGYAYYPGQLNSYLTGLTENTPYWLGVSGAVATTPSTTSGFISQYLGRSISTTGLDFNPGEPMERA